MTKTVVLGSARQKVTDGLLDTGEHSNYIHDPDGNRTALVYHPLGQVDADGNKVEAATHPGGVRWCQPPEIEAALRKGYGS